jgi:hypothetical protein
MSRTANIHNFDTFLHPFISFDGSAKQISSIIIGGDASRVNQVNPCFLYRGNHYMLTGRFAVPAESVVDWGLLLGTGNRRAGFGKSSFIRAL